MTELPLAELEKLVQVRLLSVLAERREREELRKRHAQEQLLNAQVMNRPCMMLAPLLIDRGDQWEAIRGDVIGRGETPDAAMDSFDHVFTNGVKR